ncbi:MAG: hypothetical protein V4550_08235 [Gemmatimonadota bacterium]
MHFCYAGAERLLGIKPSYDEVRIRLEGSSVLEVLDLVGRMDAMLYAGAQGDRETQRRIAFGLFGDTAQVILRRIMIRQERDHRDGHSPTEYLLFTQASLAALVQVAAAHLPLQGHSGDHRPRYQRLGEALLIIHDLIDGNEPSNPAGMPVNTEEGLRVWAYYTAVVAAELGYGPSVHAVARSVELFLSPHPELVEDASYVDLASLFTSATGLSQDEYALALFAFFGSVLRVTPDNVANTSAAITFDALREPELELSPEKIQRFFDLVGEPANAFCDRVKAHYPLAAIVPGDRLPLEQSPMVQFGEHVVCLSVRLLERRLTDGLYHVLLNANPFGESAARQRVQRFLGRVFEEYVVASVRRIATEQQRKHRTKVRVWNEKELQAACPYAKGKTSSVCDAALLVGNDLFLIEAKAKMFSLAVRTGGARDAFFEKVSEIAVDGVRQIESTLQLLNAGVFDGLGLNFRKVKRVFPIVVSLQHISVTAWLQAWIDRELCVRGVLQNQTGRPAVQAPLLMDAEGLEYVELCGEAGDKLARVIASRFKTTIAAGLSVSNWSAQNDLARKRDRSARIRHHAAVYGRLGEKLLARGNERAATEG